MIDSPALPKPTQTPIPACWAKAPALATKHATEFNLPFVTADLAAKQFARVDSACREIGRDPETMIRSAALVVYVGRNDAEVARRAAAIGRQVDELKANGLAGTPAEVTERLGQWQAKTGISRVYLQTLDLSDLAHIELIASEVAPQLLG